MTEEIKQCASCHKLGNEVSLIEISLPNFIPRNLYCVTCISILIDDSKTKQKGKSTQ